MKSMFSQVTQEPWLTAATNNIFVFSALDILSLFVMGPNKINLVTFPRPAHYKSTLPPCLFQFLFLTHKCR